MALTGVYWQPIQLPFTGGLNQRADPRTRATPFLDICLDAQLDETGGTQTRLPFAPPQGAIFGGGTLADVRRVIDYNGERLVMTKDSLYSWNAELGQYVRRATHLAAAIDERAVFATAGDQLDGDRAELNGTVIYAWTEGPVVYAGAVDSMTGSVLVPPTAVTNFTGGSTTASRPKLVPLASKIVLLNIDLNAGATRIVARALDPLNPGPGIVAAPTTLITAGGTLTGLYDATRVDSQDLVVGAATFTGTTGYVVFTLTPAMVVSSLIKARTTDGPIAVASIVGGLQTQIVRGSSASVLGDLLTTSTLADVFINEAIGTATGTPINQIAAAFRSVPTGGATRCYAFWSSQESTTSGSWRSQLGWVDTTGAVSGASNLAGYLGVASRAFDYLGSIYVWLTFGGVTSVFGSAALASVPAFQLQDTYFLFRDDGFLVGKAIAAHGGGLQPNTGQLPSVQALGGTKYAWCGTQRRRLELPNGGRGFAAREPVDVTVEFDSVRARRTAKIGATLYIAGGEVLQYDGVNLIELGHHIYPWSLSMIPNSGGSIANGIYTYKMTLRYTNAQGEQDRSTTATDADVTLSGTNAEVLLAAPPLTVTHKLSSPPANEVWRTQVNPGTTDAPFYIVSSNDPTDTATSNNRYLPNSVPPALPPLSLPTFIDQLPDATIALLEENPENGAILENITPPAAQIIFATDQRVFLAGVAGQPDTVWYSMQRIAGLVAQFNDTLTVDVPRTGGPITAVIVFDENLFVFRRTALYALPGSGLDNTGQGQNYGPARSLSVDVGAVSAEAAARTPVGVLFKSLKGWHLLDGNGGITYVGDRISDYDDEDCLSIVVVETQQQIRVLTPNRMLVWDYRSDVNQWMEWTVDDGVHACMFEGQHTYLSPTGTRTQQTTFIGTDYGLDIQTGWIKPSNLTADAQNDRATGGQSNGYVRRIQPFGEIRSAHLLWLRVAYDYIDDFSENRLWKPSPSAPGSTLQLEYGPRRRKCQSFKLRLTATAPTTIATGVSLLVPSDTGRWTATLTAGPGQSISISFILDNTLAAAIVDVRDDLALIIEDGSDWVSMPNNCGIVVTGGATQLTTGALEAAINAASTIVQITTHDGSPSSLIGIADLDGTSVSAAFPTAAAPSGEALKLTGLGLEVGQDTGLYNRLPPAQRR